MAVGSRVLKSCQRGVIHRWPNLGLTNGSPHSHCRCLWSWLEGHLPWRKTLPFQRLKLQRRKPRRASPTPISPSSDLNTRRETALPYVIIKDDKGEHIYRYGDASRLTAKRDTRGLRPFTCAAPHVFVVQKPQDKTALMKAEVVTAGEPRFPSSDSKYAFQLPQPAGESAIPRGKQSQASPRV